MGNAMTTKLEKLKAEYVAKLAATDDLIKSEKLDLFIAKESKDPENEIELRGADIRALKTARQYLVQFISDLEDLQW